MANSRKLKISLNDHLFNKKILRGFLTTCLGSHDYGDFHQRLSVSKFQITNIHFGWDPFGYFPTYSTL